MPTPGINTSTLFSLVDKLSPVLEGSFPPKFSLCKEIFSDDDLEEEEESSQV